MGKIHFTTEEVRKANESFIELCNTPEYQNYQQKLKENPDSGIRFCPKVHHSMLPEDCKALQCKHCDYISEAIKRTSNSLEV